MKEHKCICGKKFDNGHSLLRHKRTCKDYKQYKIKKQKEDLLKKELKRLPNGMFRCENPKCNKEHDGSYGSGRFCSDSCRRSFSAQHVNFIELGKKRKAKKQLLNIHEQHFKARAPYGRWRCERCNLIFETRAQLFQHNHQVHPIPKGTSWNKGLTKETDNRVARNAKHVSESFKKHIADGYVNPTWTPEYWTEKRRKERSESKKQLYREHPEKHPNRKLAGNRKKMTYPERIVYDWLVEHQIKFEHQFLFKTNRFTRYVDFYITERKLFIEVDGQYWHQQNPQIDIDKDNDAKMHGYITERISTSENILTRLQQIFST